MRHEDDRRARRQRGQAEAVLGRAEADHDQHDLGALEEDALERHREADAVAPACSASAGVLLVGSG